MLTYPAGIEALTLVAVFINIKTFGMRTAKGLADLCTASLEPSLLDNAIQNVSDVLHGTKELDSGLFVLKRMDIKHILKNMV